MSFLSVAFLFALPLAAAPLLLHLFDRRRNVEIHWGAMEFLIAASNQKTSARRFKQWLLLLLRMLAIAALIFALARPLIPGGWFSGKHRQELILVIDNSMSMSRGDEDQTFMDLARDHALDEVSELEPGDRVRLMTSAPYPAWNRAGSLRADGNARQILVDEIQSLATTDGRSDLLAAVLTASASQPGPLATRRRIVILSDGQSGDLRLNDTPGWDRFRQAIEQAQLSTEVAFVPLATQQTSRGNVAVDEVTANRLLVGVDQPVQLTAKIHNHSDVGTQGFDASWRLKDGFSTSGIQTSDSVPLDQSVIQSLGGGQSELVRYTHTFDDPGVYHLTCLIDHVDDLAADNRASVVVEVVEEIPILIVEGHPDLSTAQQDSFFVRAALGWLDEAGSDAGSDAGSIHVPTIVQTADLARQPLDPYRCIVIPNLVDLDDESLEALREFVFSGGGLWIALGPRTNIDQFNSSLFAGGNNLSPLAIEAIVDEQVVEEIAEGEEANEPVRINPFGNDHAATAVLADNERLDLGEITVRRRMKFKTGALHDQASILLSLSNGDPLVVEKLYGRGRIITQAIPLQLKWSDLATSEAFVVMVRDWADYLSQPKSTRFNLNPGDPLVYRVQDGGVSDARLQTPNQRPIELAPDTLARDPVFRTSRTRLPGSYWLQLGLADRSLPFEVARDSAESDLRPLSQVDRKTLGKLAGLKSLGTGAALAGNPQTDPLWPPLLIGLIGIIAAELVLSGLLSRERFGDRSGGLGDRIQDSGIEMSETQSLTDFRRHTTQRDVAS